MTREEAHQVKVEDRRDYTNDNWEFIFNRTKHSKLIDKIYDDFESRTCANCKFNEPRDNYCNELAVFGLKYCSKFEKDTD